MKKNDELVRVSTDIPFELWADLRKRAKRDKTTIRPYLAKLLKNFVEYQQEQERIADERNETVAKVPERVADPESEELYTED